MCCPGLGRERIVDKKTVAPDDIELCRFTFDLAADAGVLERGRGRQQMPVKQDYDDYKMLRSQKTVSLLPYVDPRGSPDPDPRPGSSGPAPWSPRSVRDRGPVEWWEVKEQYAGPRRAVLDFVGWNIFRSGDDRKRPRCIVDIDMDFSITSSTKTLPCKMSCTLPPRWN